MSGKLRLNGATSGYSELQAPDVAGNQVFTFPDTGGVLATVGNGGGGEGTPGPRYQQGTWTPVPSQGSMQTLDERNVWSRVGNTVTLSGYIKALTSTSTEVISLTGLPYPTNVVVAGAAGSSRLSTSAGGITFCYVRDADQDIRFLTTSAAKADPWVSAGYNDATPNDNGIYFSVTYQTDDTGFNPGNDADVTEDTQGIGGGGSVGVRYQEGEWTPSSEVGTLASEGAEWSRSGNLVTITAQLDNFSDTTSETPIWILGLPYPKTQFADGTTGSLMASRVNFGPGFTTSYVVSDASGERVMFFGAPASINSSWVLAHHSVLLDQASSFIFQISYLTDDTTFVPGNSATKTVDIQGTGGGGGGSGGEIGSGADAWVAFDGNSTILGGYNIPSNGVTKTSTGVYEITFTTPMPNADYAVTFGVASANTTVNINNSSKTVNGFTIQTKTADSNVAQDAPFQFAVHASTGGTPQTGIGADAWAFVAASGSLGNNFNIKDADRPSAGSFDLEFTTPMPTDEYAVVITPVNSNFYGGVSGLTKDGFTVTLRTAASGGNLSNSDFYVAVFASSTVTPTYTWGRDGTTVKTANVGDSVATGSLDIASSTSGGAAFYSSGGSRFQRPSADNSWIQQGYDGTYKVYEFNRASSGFNSDLTVHDGTPGGPNITLKADGTALFENNVYSATGFYVGAPINNARYLSAASVGASSAPLYIGNAQIQVSSDARLKTNIKDTELDALDAIQRVKVRDFNWNDPTDASFNNKNARGTWTGVIAQELVEVLPFVVNAPRKEEDLAIDHDSANTWMLDQSQLCPVLIKALQQTLTRIEALEAEVQSLKGGQS